MTDLTNLPAEITPTELFYEVVPEVLAELEIPDTVAKERVQFHITGEGGIAVNIGMDEDGDLTIEDGFSSSAILALTATTDDFQAFVAGDLRDRVLAETGQVVIGPRQLRYLFVPAAKVSLIRAYPGDIQLRLEDKELGTTYVATVTIGGATPNVDEPRCKVSLTLDTVLDILKGKQTVQQLFFTGGITIEGDMGTVLGLMGALA